MPLQTIDTIRKTVEQTISLAPDRIAFYRYAHVPWTSKAQRLFDENDLPSGNAKMELYQLGKKLFTDDGYYDIGMDHFALPHDDLYKASRHGYLHRNFMGYTTQKTAMLIGLGVSSISDAGIAYAQNHKTLHDYYYAVRAKQLAVTKGYFLTNEDTIFKQYILNIACTGKTTFTYENYIELIENSFPQFKQLEYDGLIGWNEKQITLTALGHNFIRNVCKAFDLHLLRNENKSNNSTLFSKAI